MRTTTLIAALALSLGVTLTVAFGQKGTGEATGLARQSVKPDVVALSGTVLEVKTGPCQMTTGPAAEGTHFTLQTSAGKKLDIHLGPELQVKDVAKKLAADQTTTVKAFRTERLPEDAYIAQSVTVDDETLRLRDDDLRPVWAGGMANQKGRRNDRWNADIGPGAGRGPGCAAAGRGNGPGRGCCAACLADDGKGPRCAACGMGNGRGRGRGQGMGKGLGQGMGKGLGQGMGKGLGQGIGRGPRGGAGFSNR